VAEAVRVPIGSRDRPQVVDAFSVGPVLGTCGGVRAGRLDRGELTPRAS
jgi:hypothetical protein